MMTQLHMASRNADGRVHSFQDNAPLQVLELARREARRARRAARRAER